MRILIDGDGCPVIDHAIEIAQQYGIKVTIFCDTAHHIQRDFADTIVVNKGNDAVDFKIANETTKDDIVITGDYGLASMCKAKNANVISQNGLVFTESNLDGLLFSRHIGKEIRRKGGRTKGPKKRDKSKDELFKTSLIELIKSILYKHTKGDSNNE